jgi:hypothetical protein
VSLWMAPTTTMAAPGCYLHFGSLEFVTDQSGKFGLRTTIASLQAICFGSLNFSTNNTDILCRLTGKEAAAPTATTSLSPLGAFPCPRYIAVADTYPEDGAFNSFSKDEGYQSERHCCMSQTGADDSANAGGAADRTLDNACPSGFPNLAKETGPVVFTPGELEEYRREQLDRIRAESVGLNVQRQKLERLIREHDTKLEQLLTVSIEHS